MQLELIEAVRVKTENKQTNKQTKQNKTNKKQYLINVGKFKLRVNEVLFME